MNTAERACSVGETGALGYSSILSFEVKQNPGIRFSPALWHAIFSLLPAFNE